MMYKLLQVIFNSDEKNALGEFILELGNDHKRYFLRNEILQAFADYCHQFQKHAKVYTTLIDEEVVTASECKWALRNWPSGWALTTSRTP